MTALYSMSTIIAVISHKVYIPQILIRVSPASYQTRRGSACQYLFGNPTKSDCLVVGVVIILQSFTDEAALTRTLPLRSNFAITSLSISTVYKYFLVDCIFFNHKMVSLEGCIIANLLNFVFDAFRICDAVKMGL